jgi:hypothetical protein
LTTLWRSWGVEPSILVGHSIGEIVAACVAGVMSLADGLRLAAARGRLMQALPRDGGMAAIRCDAARAAGAIAPYRDHVSIAAINSPVDVVISGRLEQLDAVVGGLERQGVTVTRLKVSHAFHSPLMDPMLAEFRRVAQSVAYSPPALPIVSNVTGRLATSDIATAEYWVRHVREAVRFADGIAAADAHGVDVLLEVGPAPVLLGLTRQCLPGSTHVLVPSLRAGRSDWRQIAEAAASLYVAGVPIDWAAFDRGYHRRRLHLPTYPFQRKSYWMEPPALPAVAAAGTTVHGSLLGHRLRLPGSQEIRFEAQWTPHSPAYLDDHRIFDTVVVPGASHVAMALTAIREISRHDVAVLEDIVFPQALTLSDDSMRTAQLVLRQDGERGTSFEVLTLGEGEDGNEHSSWVTHATGRADLSGETARADLPATGTIGEWQARCPRPSQESFYDRFWEAGYHLRGAFRWIARTWAGDGEMLCELRWPDLPDAADYPLYPSLIDSCFQCVFSDTASELLREGAVYVPFSIRRFEFLGSPRAGVPLWCHVRLSRPVGGVGSGVYADITLCEEDGRVVARIEDCQLREVRREALLQERPKDLTDSLYEVEWQACPRASAAAPSPATEPGLWVVLADTATSVGDRLVRRLEAQGERCVRVEAGASYRRLAPGHYEIDALSPEDVRRVLEDVSAAGAPPCRGIVHLWSLDTAPELRERAGASEPRERSGAPGAPASERAGGSGRRRAEGALASLAEAVAKAGGAKPPGQERAVAGALHVVQAVARIEWTTSPRLWLVTRGAQPVEPLPNLAVQQAPLWGLGRVIAHGASRARLRARRSRPLSGDRRRRAAVRRGLGTRRAGPAGVPAGRSLRAAARALDGLGDKGTIHDTAVEPCPFQVRLSAYGQLDNVVRKPMSRRAPAAGEVEIQVRAAGLNFRDVLIALGLLAGALRAHLGVTSAAEMTFGFECAGTVVAVGEGVSHLSVGDDVIALATHGALGSFVTLRHEFVVPKPAALSFEEAATLPLAFLTAYYGLDRLATAPARRARADPCRGRRRRAGLRAVGPPRRRRGLRHGEPRRSGTSCDRRRRARDELAHARLRRRGRWR